MFVQAYLYIDKELVRLDNYFVKNDGTILSKWSGKDRILKTRILNGYVKINLKVGTKKQMTCEVHRIVASTFVENENPKDKPYVNHMDGCKTNNIWTNLEWVDQKGNTKHAQETGLMPNHTQPTLRKLSDDDVKYIRKHYKPYDKEFGRYALARKFNVDPRIVFCILKGETYKDVN